MSQRCALISISFVDVGKVLPHKWASRQHGRQQEVANALGVHKSVVSNWLAFRQELTGEQALALLEFLGEARRSEAFFWGIWDDQ